MASSCSINCVALATLVLLCLAMTEASIYRTMSKKRSTPEEEMFPEAANEGVPVPTWCEMEQMELDECKMYVEHGGRSGHDDSEEDELMIRSWLIKRGGSRRRAVPPRQCCMQLSEMEEDCRCDAIRQLLSGWEGSMVHQARMKRAENLPGICGLRPDRCHIQSA